MTILGRTLKNQPKSVKNGCSHHRKTTRDIRRPRHLLLLLVPLFLLLFPSLKLPPGSPQKVQGKREGEAGGGKGPRKYFDQKWAWHSRECTFSQITFLVFSQNQRCLGSLGGSRASPGPLRGPRGPAGLPMMSWVPFWGPLRGQGRPEGATVCRGGKWAKPVE